MSRKSVFHYKQHNILLLFTITIFVILVATSVFIHKITLDKFYHSEEEKWVGIAKLLGLQINGDQHQLLAEEGNFQSQSYIQLNQLLIDVQKNISDINFIHTMVETESPAIWKVILNTDLEREHYLVEDTYDGDWESEIYKIYSRSITDTILIPNREKFYISVYTPILNSIGETIGILVIDIDTSSSPIWLSDLIKKETFFTAMLLLLLMSYIFYNKRCYRGIVEYFLSTLENFKDTEDRFLFSEDLPGEWDLIAKKLNQITEENFEFRKRQVIQQKKVVNEKEKIINIYRDVIYAVSQQKILLVNEIEFFRKISEDFPLYSTKIMGTRDISRCRQEVGDYLVKYCPGLEASERRKILLCLSEATTNVIKNAGEGEVLLSLDHEKVTIYVLDRGPGMDLKKLPYMVFIKGYSTKATSLGSGFYLLQHYMDRVTLCSTNQGTFLALELKASK